MSADSPPAGALDGGSADEIVATLKRIIVEELDVNVNVHSFDERTPLMEGGLDLDSVVLVQMIAVVEDKLCFEFLESDLRMRTFRNLRALAEVIARRIQDHHNAPRHNED
jgi:acyl carrier protein